MMSEDTGHGGARSGAGRPSGSMNKRSTALADDLLAEGLCPVRALIRLAERAEENDDLPTAITAWKAVVPYIHARPKPVESDPDGVIDLAQALKGAAGLNDTQMNFADQVERYIEWRDRAA